MARIARSAQPLYQTRGRRVSWPIALTNPDGSPTNMTGGSAQASLRWDGTVRALTVPALDATGHFTVTGDAPLTVTLPLGQVSEMVLTVTDSLGAVTDYVWPVIGEEP